MPDNAHTLQVWEQKSLSDHQKNRSEWVKHEASQLINELFDDVEHHLDAAGISEAPAQSLDAMDVDWVDGIEPAERDKRGKLRKLWSREDANFPHRDLRDLDSEPWIQPSHPVQSYRKFLLLLGGIALTLPLSLWAGHQMKSASAGRSVVAATPTQTISSTSRSDRNFAQYSERAFKQILNQPKVTSPSTPSTSLAAATLSQTLLSSNRAMSAQNSLGLPQNSVAQTQGPGLSNTTIPRVALSTQPQASLKTADIPTPAIDSNDQLRNSPDIAPQQTAASVGLPELPALSPASDLPLPSLVPNSAPLTLAAATPMGAPVNPENKVIGILEAGLQSTLMVENNGNYHNFQVGETVNSSGWRLVQIAQGKAVLQKGQELKTLSEGQYF